MNSVHIVTPAGIAGVRMAWMRQGKVFKKHEYVPVHWIPAIPAGMTGLLAFVDLAECST